MEGEFDPFTLENSLNLIFMQNMGRIFRSKGVLYFRKAPYPVVFQGVFDSLSFDELERTEVNKKINKMIFIGKDLNQEKIETSLRSCLVVEE
jgi:G3E family GTPase